MLQKLHYIAGKIDTVNLKNSYVRGFERGGLYDRTRSGKSAVSEKHRTVNAGEMFKLRIFMCDESLTVLRRMKKHF